MSKSFPYQAFQESKFDYNFFERVFLLIVYDCCIEIDFHALTLSFCFALHILKLSQIYTVLLEVVEKESQGINKLVSICNPIHPLTFVMFIKGKLTMG